MLTPPCLSSHKPQLNSNSLPEPRTSPLGSCIMLPPPLPFPTCSGIPHLVDQILGRVKLFYTAYHSLAQAVCLAKSFTCKHDLLHDSDFSSLELLLDQESQQYGMRILLSDPPHPLAHALFEALLLAISAVPVAQATGLTCIAILLHQLTLITFFGPSHEAWLPRCSATHRQSLRRLHWTQIIRASKT